MHDLTLASALEGTVLLSTSATVAIGARLALAPASRRPPSHSRPRSRTVSLLLHPLAQFLLVCAIIYVNQVLFGAFILRAHGGSAAFISRFIGAGWFAIGTHDPLVRFAAAHVGDGQWLSPTLLRAQAFLELPFTMFAYLAVARLLGRRTYATICKLPVLVLASISFSVTFSLVELSLPNPFTHDDLVLRAVACAFMPVYIAWISRKEAERSPEEDEAGPSGALGLLTFLAGAGAIAYVVLALYDAFLLYNLAHLPRYASGLAIAVVIAAASSVAGPRIDAAVRKACAPFGSAWLVSHEAMGAAGPSPTIDVSVSALRAFTILFFVPSLALRYWGAHPSAVMCGLLVVLLGLVGGTVAALRRSKPSPGAILRLGTAGAIALAVGGGAAHFALATAGHGMRELVLARVALSFLVAAIVTFRAVEIFVCWAGHETKAQADEA